MSGYGGGPPSGWEDPYGGGSKGWDPGGAYGPQYGAGQGQGYGYGQGGYGYGPPGVPYRTPSSGSTIAALVCNCIAVVMCCNIVAIPGVITAAVALGRNTTDPNSARKLTIWSWSLFAAAVVVGIIFIVIYVVVIAATEPDYNSSGGI
ncbi:hypothetical protein E1264_27540 [Actinomadura sp. KC216]|uniref:hypothetical protein n=1 Tax=Actinomadura sp. KC216 TaxID=2530370 RepID=UPI001045AAEC|nr:hypothetical protein [Actinomadura sp. KC216]TDB83670.1 hypothetical protein E1264_27540 [Actinomadura sp. KC216]